MPVIERRQGIVRTRPRPPGQGPRRSPSPGRRPSTDTPRDRRPVFGRRSDSDRRSRPARRWGPVRCHQLPAAWRLVPRSEPWGRWASRQVTPSRPTIASWAVPARSSRRSPSAQFDRTGSQPEPDAARGDDDDLVVGVVVRAVSIAWPVRPGARLETFRDEARPQGAGLGHGRGMVPGVGRWHVASAGRAPTVPR